MQHASQFVSFNVQPAVGGRQLFSWSDIDSCWRGRFRAPAYYSYSFVPHTQLANGNILLAGHRYYDKARELEVPSDLSGEPIATTVGDEFSVADLLEPVNTLNGLFERNGKVHTSAHQFYNAIPTDNPSQGYFENGTKHGPWTVEGVVSKYAAGALSAVPSSLIGQFDYLSVTQGSAGSAGNRNGPNLTAIEVRGGSPRGLPLLQRGMSSPLPGWWVADGSNNGLWIETPTHHCVLFIVPRGQDNKRYEGGVGYLADNWTVEAFLYDPDDLLAVASGEIQAGTPEPYEITVITDKFGNPTGNTRIGLDSSRVGTIGTSYRDGVLTMAEEGAWQHSWATAPVFNIFDFGIGI